MKVQWKHHALDSTMYFTSQREKSPVNIPRFDWELLKPECQSGTLTTKSLWLEYEKLAYTIYRPYSISIHATCAIYVPYCILTKMEESCLSDWVARNSLLPPNMTIILKFGPDPNTVAVFESRRPICLGREICTGGGKSNCLMYTMHYKTNLAEGLWIQCLSIEITRIISVHLNLGILTPSSVGYCFLSQILGMQLNALVYATKTTFDATHHSPNY